MKLSFLLILIVSVLSLNRVSESAEPQIPKETEPQSKELQLHQEKSAKQETATKSTSNVKAVYSLPKQLIANSPTQKQATRVGTDSTWWFNLFIVIFTFCLVCVGIGQVAIYMKQARYFKTTERAWLAVVFDHPFQPKVGAVNPINYSIKNTGHTVAWLKSAKLKSMQWEFGHIPERQLEPKPVDALSTIAVVFPGGKFPLEGLVDIDFTQQMINDSATGRFIFDVYGYVAYDDAFGNRHITRFCQVYNPNGDGGSFTYPREAQPGYNDAD